MIEGEVMRPTARKYFDGLNRPKEDCIEPVPRAIGTYDMARMIAKKTKFRVLDVKEVLDEVGPCIYGILLSRQSIRFDGLNIRSAWKRFGRPKFIRFEGGSDDNGYWTYGYFYPQIDMEKQWQMLYSGAKGSMPKEFIDRIKPYLPEGIETPDDIYIYCTSIMEETAQMGKNTVVDEYGFTIPLPPRRRRYKFDPNFHPTAREWREYLYKKGKLLLEYHELKRNGKKPSFGMVWEGLKDTMIYRKYKMDGRLEAPDEEDIDELNEE